MTVFNGREKRVIFDFTMDLSVFWYLNLPPKIPEKHRTIWSIFLSHPASIDLLVSATKQFLL